MTAKRTERAGLYFILNPALGIIKIGISEDVASRHRGLEHACGISLDLLRFVANGQQYERDLHIALTDTRLRGEWFAPTDELLALVDGTESVPAFLGRKAPEIAARAEAIRVAGEAERAARHEATRRETEELKRLAAEKLRVERERAEKRERLRVEREDKQRVARLTEQQLWANATPDALRDRVISAPHAAEAAQRRRLVADQRARNASLVGVEVAGGQRSGD